MLQLKYESFLYRCFKVDVIHVFLRKMASWVIGYLLNFQEIKIEWGKGLAQKREAEAKLKELEVEKEKPFARTRYTEKKVVLWTVLNLLSYYCSNLLLSY